MNRVSFVKKKAMIYAFWNNKGGTGKTSLAFQSICRYAELNSDQRILAVDLCPQANLSELLLGGLEGNGSESLNTLYNLNGRVSIGGYFETRLTNPYNMPAIDPEHFLSKPHQFNSNIPENIELLAGDRIVELQANAIASLSNTNIPGKKDPWLAVIDWLKDFIESTDGKYTTIFIDTNPSFSMYTQIALSTANRLILPVMADDSSRRAVRNALTLVHGIQLPSSDYDKYSFSRKLRDARRNLPKVHLLVKNRLTQYMGPSSAYHSVLTSIDEDLINVMKTDPGILTFSNVSHGISEVRDFQTTGVVAFALGKPFSRLKAARHQIREGEVQVKKEYLDLCQDAIEELVNRL